jgi:hypothetical protein
MLEGMGEAWNSLWRIFSLDTYTGELNVFNNFSKMLKDLRGTVMSIGIEVAKQVFDGGAEIFKGVRDEFVRAFGGNPSSDDASKATSSMSNQLGGAKNAVSGMPSMNNLLGGGSSTNSGSSAQLGSNNIVPTGKKLSDKLAQQRMMRDFYSQKGAQPARMD